MLKWRRRGERSGGKTPLWVNPFHSLPTRISLIVLGATLVTSLIVTAISVNSIDSFLRGKIEQKFPAILAASSQKLDLWYDQRILEIGVFATSATLAKNVSRLGPASPAGQRERAYSEVRQYLTYVLDGFPQYCTLFLLDGDGDVLLWVGEEIDIPEALRLEASGVASTGLTNVVAHADRRTQLASAAVMSLREQRVGSLHAVLQLETLDQILRGSELLPEVEVFAVAQDNRYVSTSPERARQQRFNRPLTQADAENAVVEYANHDGERVVGTTRPFPRFGWTLVVEEPYASAFEPVVAGIRRVIAIDLAIVILFGLLAYRVAVSMVRPIEVLSDAAHRISAGEVNVAIPEAKSRDEVGLLSRTFGEMTVQLANNARELQVSQREVEQALERLRIQNEELQRVNEVLEQLSITDGLTRLHNHRFFQEFLTKQVKRADRTQEPLALILIDIDHFKRWNDRLGHSGGDEILRRVAVVMNGVIRGTDLLARYGGEEFALLAGNTELDGAVQLAEKIRSEISCTTFTIDPPSERDQVTVSIGVAAYRGDRKALFDAADRALYRAKAAGRDCVMTAEHEDG
jgi:diguanylate cyclase (GGDEF)-like protein